jgi:hypothetical protein
MADESAPDDGLSQRERRAQHHKETYRKELPKTLARTYGVWLLVVLVLGASGYAIYKTSTGGEPCPGHWHSTFEVFVPGPGGQPEKIDMATPRGANGAFYYDLSGGAGMAVAVHMHQQGAEAGAADARPAQWHFEPLDSSCIGVKTALHAVEIDATATSLKLFGAHAQVHQDRTWEANATHTLRLFVESKANGTWTWGERTWSSLKSHQMQDGERLLVAFGKYTPDQIDKMEKGVPLPQSGRY